MTSEGGTSFLELEVPLSFRRLITLTLKPLSLEGLLLYLIMEPLSNGW